MRLRYPLMAVLGLTVALALIGLSEASKPTTTTILTFSEPIFEPTVETEYVVRLAVWPPPPMWPTPEGDVGTGGSVDLGDRPEVVCAPGIPAGYMEWCT